MNLDWDRILYLFEQFVVQRRPIAVFNLHVAYFFAPSGSNRIRSDQNDARVLRTPSARQGGPTLLELPDAITCIRILLMDSYSSDCLVKALYIIFSI